jgi:hypothetical protein
MRRASALPGGQRPQRLPSIRRAQLGFVCVLLCEGWHFGGVNSIWGEKAIQPARGHQAIFLPGVPAQLISMISSCILSTRPLTSGLPELVIADILA